MRDLTLVLISAVFSPVMLEQQEDPLAQTRYPGVKSTAGNSLITHCLFLMTDRFPSRATYRRQVFYSLIPGCILNKVFG